MTTTTLSFPTAGFPGVRLLARADAGVLAAGFAALVFLPWLGSVGLWDPWETHYSEVGREMLSRGDLIHPFWENGWFFSKPPLTPWLAAFGLWVVRGAEGAGELPRYAEWAIRLPFAALAIVAVGLLSSSVARHAGRSAGLTTGFVLATMPLFFFTARQAMTDMPFVAAITIAWACALRGEKWWWGFYAAMAVATLGKGLLGGLPAVCFTVYWVIARPLPLKEQVKDMKLLPGAAVFCVIALPWYLAMIAFDQRDFEGKLFWERFFLHDHLNRLVAGVHTTTPGGTFTYFLEQGGYALFPWVALLPGSLAHALRGRDRLTVWSVVTMGVSFALFTASATKFHHYVLPVLPAVAVLIGVFIARVLDEGVAPHGLSLFLGLVLFGLVGRDLAGQPRHFLDLFTYNYDRPYPEFLLAAPAWSEWFTVKNALAGAFGLAAIAGLAAVVKRSGIGVVGAVGGLALGLSLWLSWSHWLSLSHHWTQRDLFWRYWQQAVPGEPIAAFFMDWKGETFYSRNTVVQLKPENAARDLPAFLARPGRKWMLVEHARLNVLRGAIPAQHPMQLIEPGLNNKFVLVQVD